MLAVYGQHVLGSFHRYPVEMIPPLKHIANVALLHITFTLGKLDRIKIGPH